MYIFLMELDYAWEDILINLNDFKEPYQISIMHENNFPMLIHSGKYQKKPECDDEFI